MISVDISETVGEIIIVIIVNDIISVIIMIKKARKRGERERRARTECRRSY